MPRTSSQRRFFDAVLDEPLETYVRLRREDGQSWRLIAQDLYRETSQDVTAETLRAWFGSKDWAGAA